MISTNLYEEMKQHLEQKLLPFWKALKDDTYGGYYGWMDSALVLDKEAVKGCILNSRILWFFSNAMRTAEVAQQEELRVYADHAYRFLRDTCYDKERGGVYWSVGYDGKPEDTTKHTYNQAFAVYALSSYYRATGEQEALELARELVDLIESKCYDGQGYLEAQSIDFHPVSNDKLSENGVMAERTMNTLLHVLEAYTEYYLVTKEARVGKKLRWMLDLVAEHIYNPALHRQEVFFDLQMNSLIDLHSYGHDIETSWLVDRCTEVLGDATYTARMNIITADLAEHVYEVAYGSHSLANECEKGVVDEKRIWWVQAEAVVGFYNAYQRTGEERYRNAAEDIWQFILHHVVDERAGGEWFWYTDAEGKPDLAKPIVEPWKCPYHNGRMCMELMQRTQA